jgi:putative membrane protein
MMFWGFELFGFWMVFWWIIFLFIGYLVYQDAEKRGMNGLLWFILVILPMVGILFLIIYVILREVSPRESEEHNKALEILKERYARGEITQEEFQKMREELER